ncbi:hypothetical protein GGI04_004858 [Coemansia thaxteri]|nr:hypothetical protein GGI04_004858 [Coemansia thaxteri]
MCIVFWRLLDSHAVSRTNSPYRLVLAFNRDEYFDRPTRGFHIWPSQSNIYAPQDLRPLDEAQRGSWLGVNRQGRLALLTNFREPDAALSHHDNMISRGALVRDFLLHVPVTPGGQTLANKESVWDYAQGVFDERQSYDGFNLVLFDLKAPEVVYVTNRGAAGGEIKRIESGCVVGLSNSTIDNESWPKVRLGKAAFAQAMESAADGERNVIEALMQVMGDSHPFSTDRRMPQTVEDLAHCIFVPEISGLGGGLAKGLYGTRTTDVILLSDQRLTIAEREYSQGSKGVKVTRLDIV